MLARGGFLGGVMAMRLISEPFREMTHSGLYIASDAWERAQVGLEAQRVAGNSEQGRDFRILISARNTLESRFLDRVRHLLLSGQPWEHLPASYRTVEKRCLLHRMLSRMGCCVEELLVKPNNANTTRVFLMLDDDSFAEEVLNDKECLLGSFVETLTKLFPGEGFKGPDVRMILRTMARIIRKENVAIENNNATLRRYVYKTAQVHRMSASQLSSFWIWSILKKQKRARVIRPLERIRLKVIDKKIKTCTRGGGMWRAYVRKMTFETSGKPDIKALAVKYKTLPDNIKAECMLLGKLATEKVRNTKKHGFGGRRRDSHKRGLTRRAEYTVGRLLNAGNAESAAGKLISDAIVQVEGVVANATSRQANVVSRAVARIYGAAKKQESQEMIWQPLEDYNKRAAAVCIEKAASAMPKLEALRSDLVATPDSHGTTLEFQPDTATMAAKVCSFADDHSNASNASSALCCDWAMRMASMKDIKLLPMAKPSKEELRRLKCLEFGVCVHEGDGLDLWCFTNKYLAVQKAPFKKGLENRLLLDDGFICVRLEWQRLEVDGCDDPDEYEVMEPPPPLQMTGVQWANIGLQYFSPYRPTFMLMSERKPAVNERFPPNHVPLQASGLGVGTVGLSCIIHDSFHDWYLVYSPFHIQFHTILTC
jgi:hypothetical protein